MVITEPVVSVEPPVIMVVSEPLVSVELPVMVMPEPVVSVELPVMVMPEPVVSVELPVPGVTPEPSELSGNPRLPQMSGVVQAFDENELLDPTFRTSASPFLLISVCRIQ